MFIAPERYHLFLENGLRRFSCNDFLPEKSLTKIVHVLFISDTMLETCQKRNMKEWTELHRNKQNGNRNEWQKWMQISRHAPVKVYSVQQGKCYSEVESSELQKDWETCETRPRQAFLTKWFARQAVARSECDLTDFKPNLFTIDE